MRYMIYIITFLFFLTPLSVPTSAEDLSGVIKGKVLNKTLDGKGMGGIEVVLHKQLKGKDTEEGRSTTDDTGVFVFQGVKPVEGAVYYVFAKYMDLSYYSKGSHFHTKDSLSLDLTVFETTDKDDDIRVKMHHVFLDWDEGVLKVRELMIVENQGNTVYIGSQSAESHRRETLKVSLPGGAGNIHYEEPLMPSHVLETGGGFTDAMEIRPGVKRVSFSYTANTSGSRYTFTKGIHLDTDHMDFIVPDAGFGVMSEQLALKESSVNSRQKFYHLSGKNITQGTRIVLELSGLPWTKRIYRWIIVGLMGVFLGAGLTIPLFRGNDQQQEKSLNAKSRNGSHLAEQRRRLLKTIAELDDLSESGEIDLNEYKQKRKKLLTKAIGLTKQLNTWSDM